MPLWSFARTLLVNPKNLQRVRLTAVSDLVPGQNPFNLATSLGEYYVAFVRAGDAQVEHATWGSPPWQFLGPATNTGDVSEPRLAVLATRRLWILYTRGGAQVYEKASDDEARTWGAETLLWDPGSHPDVCAAADGSLLRAAYVGGAIDATWQGAGDAAPSLAFTLSDGASPLSVEDDSFRIVPDAHRFWWLHVRILGEGKTSLWASSDEAQTWQRLADGVTGGTHPGIAAAPDGSLLAWAYLAGALQCLAKGPAPLGTFSAPAAIKDPGAVALSVADDTASFAPAREGPRRWLLVVGIAGAGFVSDWASADEGASAAPL